MTNPQADDERSLDSAAAQAIARVRWLMLIAGATTLIAIAAVLGVIGYRLFHAEGSASAIVQMTAMLPKGARIVRTAIGQDRIVLTLDIGGTTEIRTFDLHSLKPTGRLRFATEP